MPDVYTHGHHDSVLRSHRWRTAENSAAYLLDHLAPGQRVLDVGCGPGTLTADLAARVAPGGEVVGVDVADDVVDEARRHAAEVGAANVTFRAGDVRGLGLPERSFDVVHAHQVLQHVEDPVGLLVHMGRLARPGGVVAARDSDYGSFAWAPDDAGLDRWGEVYRAVTLRNRAESNAGRYLLGWAQRAGLRDVTYSSSTWTFATPADRAWWSDLWAERAVASSFAEQAVGYGICTRDELDDMAAAWRRWGAAGDGSLVIVHGEVVCRA